MDRGLAYSRQCAGTMQLGPCGLTMRAQRTSTTRSSCAASVCFRPPPSPLHSRQLLNIERVLTSASKLVCRAVSTVTAPVKASDAQDAIPRGETAGAVMLLEDVTVQAGVRDLLDGVSWRMMPGQRIGLVGANGAGKSTLLKCICGLRSVDSGKLLVSNGVALGYLAQTAVSGSQQTLYQEARSAMTQLTEAEAAMEAAGEAAAAGDPAAGDMLIDAQEAFEAAGGYDADRRIGTVLDGLGFRRDQWDWSCADFSGGWQMRIALARLLLSPAGQAATAGTPTRGGRSNSSSSGSSGGLLVLDEPTNHLDAAAIKWLAQFLANSGGSLVLVSHDEVLLEGACDRMVEIRGRQLHHYVGSYSKFLELREERASLAAATAASQAAEIARLEQFITRFGAKASKASEAQSKMKLLEKLKKEAVQIPAAASGAGPGDSKKMNLKLPPAPPCYTDVLKLEGVAVGWGSPPSAAAAVESSTDSDSEQPPAKPVVSGVNLMIQKGQRVLVLGPNGAGKSTLLKAMSGRIAPWEGSIKLGEGVKIAVFNQDLAQELPAGAIALDYVSEQARKSDPTITLEKCRQAVGALGLTGSLPLQTIGSLSGGEKARVALAVFALVPANVLLLDEASNHLDAATLEVLTGALQGFTGAIVAITHNPAFAANLQPTHILRVQGGTAKLSGHSGPISSKEFDHSSSSSSSGGNSNGASSSSSSGGGKGKAAAASTSSSRGGNGNGKGKKVRGVVSGRSGA